MNFPGATKRVYTSSRKGGSSICDGKGGGRYGGCVGIVRVLPLSGVHRDSPTSGPGGGCDSGHSKEHL